jgi:hypothetical protein
MTTVDFVGATASASMVNKSLEVTPKNSGAPLPNVKLSYLLTPRTRAGRVVPICGQFAPVELLNI